jgi:hypothetical protein
MLTGGCFCGEIRYEAEQTLHCCNCHCTICRRTTGAPFVTWLTAQRSTFRITRGEPKELRSSPEATRSFCPNCGTPLTFARDNLFGEIDLTVGSLDDPDFAAPSHHIFTSSKLAWINLAHGLPEYSADLPAG